MVEDEQLVGQVEHVGRVVRHDERGQALVDVPSHEVAAPSIAQCHASFECRLHETRITRDYPLFVWRVVHARVARSPKLPRTVHYRGDGRFMLSGDEVSRRRLFRPEMLEQ